MQLPQKREVWIRSVFPARYIVEQLVLFVLINKQSNILFLSLHVMLFLLDIICVLYM